MCWEARGVAALCRPGKCAREREGCVWTEAHSHRERATRMRMPQRETRPRRDARARECSGGWGGVAALPCSLPDADLRACLPPATGTMADSEHDDTYEDAERSEDEQPEKTRKTAGGRVVIKS
eukprot:7178457-Prymnesium_polylepis.1